MEIELRRVRENRVSTFIRVNLRGTDSGDGVHVSNHGVADVVANLKGSNVKKTVNSVEWAGESSIIRAPIQVACNESGCCKRARHWMTGAKKCTVSQPRNDL
jgi:hypothetical protein